MRHQPNCSVWNQSLQIPVVTTSVLALRQVRTSNTQAQGLLIIIYIWSLLKISLIIIKKSKYQKLLGSVTVKVVVFVIYKLVLVKCGMFFNWSVEEPGGCSIYNKQIYKSTSGKTIFLFLFLGDSQPGECLRLAVAGAPRYGPRRTRVSLQEYGFPPQEAHWWERWMHRSMMTYLSHIELMWNSRCRLHSFSCVLFVHWVSISSAPFYYTSENL